MPWWYYAIILGVATLFAVAFLFYGRAVDRYKARREAKLTPEEREKRRERDEREGRIAAYLMLAALAAWLATCFFGDEFAGPASGDPATAPAEAAVGRALSEDLGLNDPSTFRIQPRAVGNVRVYIPKPSWERVPFPDRGRARTMIGKAWCESARHSFFLPADQFGTSARATSLPATIATFCQGAALPVDQHAMIVEE